MNLNSTSICPHMAAQGRPSATEETRLVRFSEVELTAAPDTALRCITSWVREFLARPHPELGRKGSVCPFVPQSIEMDTIWVAEVAEANPSFDRIAALITEYRDKFLETEPRDGVEALQKSFLVVFSSLGVDDPESAALVDKVQGALKRHFVEVGLMLGEFHANNEGGGLRNPDFRPLRSPIPMLAIRYLVDSDLPFLVRENYSADERSAFLRSYLMRIGHQLTPARWEHVLGNLIDAEIELWQQGSGLLHRVGGRQPEVREESLA